ncbi:hypothetical protein KKH81_03490 [Patescibacteria group bacterium]|nr:hypothetical protein [Patescibacteria group bacterium]
MNLSISVQEEVREIVPQLQLGQHQQIGDTGLFVAHQTTEMDDSRFTLVSSLEIDGRTYNIYSAT